MKYDSRWLSDSWGMKKNHWFTSSRCLSHCAAPQRCLYREISDRSAHEAESKQTTCKHWDKKKQGSWGTRNKRVSHNWSHHYSRVDQHGGKTKRPTKGRLADGIRQRTGRDNLNRHRSWRNLITLLDLCVSSPHCLPINRHITQ